MVHRNNDRPPQGMYIITNPRSKAKGMLVEIVQRQTSGTINGIKTRYLCRKGDGKTFWTMAHHVRRYQPK